MALLYASVSYSKMRKNAYVNRIVGEIKMTRVKLSYVPGTANAQQVLKTVTTRNSVEVSLTH